MTERDVGWRDYVLAGIAVVLTLCVAVAILIGLGIGVFSGLVIIYGIPIVLLMTDWKGGKRK